MTHPVFYFDLVSPDAYLTAERVVSVLGVVPEFQPVRLSGLAAGELGAFRCAQELLAYREDVERRARQYGLQALRWPEPFPADTDLAMRVATYAKGIGRVVAFALAAFRQAFAAGRDLGDPDSVLIAAAACEMHPAAVLKGADLRGTRDRLRAATEAAVEAGVLDVPAIRVGGAVFHGDEELRRAAEAIGATGGAGA